MQTLRGWTVRRLYTDLHALMPQWPDPQKVQCNVETLPNCGSVELRTSVVPALVMHQNGSMRAYFDLVPTAATERPNVFPLQIRGEGEFGRRANVIGLISLMRLVGLAHEYCQKKIPMYDVRGLAWARGALVTGTIPARTVDLLPVFTVTNERYFDGIQLVEPHLFNEGSHVPLHLEAGERGLALVIPAAKSVLATA